MTDKHDKEAAERDLFVETAKNFFGMDYVRLEGYETTTGRWRFYDATVEHQWQGWGLARAALTASEAKAVPEGFMDFALEAIGTVALRDDESAKELAAKLRALLSQAAPVQQAASQQPEGWISVEDRLPVDKSDVLVYCDDTREQFVGFRLRTGDFQYAIDRHGETIVCRPSHWQPLPAAPSGAQSKESEQ